MSKPNISIPKGTRDFSPEIMLKRQYIFDTIKEVFRIYGYSPIETPTMENLSTLLGKYGEEGDKLIFKVLNSGDFLASCNEKQLQEKDSKTLSGLISEKGLRYDLTVPFARFVSMNRNDITFPFKRYQIQPVWRADKPQKGRYREFYQCDADIVGSNSLLNELEVVQIIDEVFKRLGTSVTIKINNRKLLAGIAQMIGHPEKIIDITVAIDKIDKIGKEKVIEELKSKEIDTVSVEKLIPLLDFTGSFEEKIKFLKTYLKSSEIGSTGINEIEKLFDYIEKSEISSKIELDLTLARGLNYYTGAIFEVKSNDVEIGSISGGGRYDNLTGVFGLEGVSGVGISFGADRIFDVLEKLEKFPDSSKNSIKIMFTNFGEKEENYCLPILNNLRKNGIISEIYPQSEKMKKQMNYADKRGVEFVAIVGENEISQAKISLKNMKTGEQILVEKDNILNELNK